MIATLKGDLPADSTVCAQGPTPASPTSPTLLQAEQHLPVAPNTTMNEHFLLILLLTLSCLAVRAPPLQLASHFP